MTLDEIRRRPTLPGRFQPSTISVLRLNFCVRYGNRWIPQAIVTGKEQGSRPLLPPFCFRPFGLHQPRDFLISAFARASHPQNCTGLSFSVPLRFARPRLRFASPPIQLHKSSLGLRSRPQVFASLLALLIPDPFSLIPSLPRSSPRPISIIKLHTLLRFHR